MKKINLPVLIIIIVVSLALGQLLLTHRLATDGEMVKELELQATRLEEKNEILKQEITQLGSLREIGQKAEKLGFVHNSQLLHLTPELPVAMNY